MHRIHNPRISRHAYERFCERFFPCDFETAQLFILSPVVEFAAAVGAGRVRSASLDMAVCINEGVVTTVWRLSEFGAGCCSRMTRETPITEGALA